MPMTRRVGLIGSVRDFTYLELYVTHYSNEVNP